MGVNSNFDRSLSVVSDRVVERLSHPTEQARGLPNDAFTSDEFFQLEQKTLFANSWTFAAPASDVPHPGDMKPIEVAGRSLILARGQHGDINVFHNVCPHRGARLLIEANSGQQTLVCPYHAWSFNLEGHLQGRPHYHGPDRHDRDSTDPQRPCLFRVRSHTWYDWVFVNLSAKAPAFEDYVAPFVSEFQGFDLSVFKPGAYRRFEFDSNWKLTVENYCDFYHVFKVHPALHQMMAQDARRAMQPGGAHLFNGYSFAGNGRGLVVDDDSPDLPMIAGLSDNLKNTMVYGNLFPNIAINVYPTNLQFVLFEPVAAGKSAMHMWFYFVGDAADNETCRNARDTLCEEWADLNAEDLDICRRLQEGRHCDAYDGGRLAPYWDSGTLHFHQQVADAIHQRGHFAPSIDA